MLVILLLLVFLTSSANARLPSTESGNPDAKRLYDDLLSNYNKLVRPVVNTTDPLTVRIKLKLSQLIDVVSEKCIFILRLVMVCKTIDHSDVAMVDAEAMLEEKIWRKEHWTIAH